MEVNTRYHYTYFIYPYRIKRKQFHQYLLRVLESKNWKRKLFEKEKDLELYTYFTPYARDYFFAGMQDTKENIEALENLHPYNQSKLLSKQNCVYFEYKQEDVQGKAGMLDGIFFGISKIEMICFASGICFLCFKTEIESSKLFSDVLDFNYKFKNMKDNFVGLSNFEQIKIQTNHFQNMQTLPEFIFQITGSKMQQNGFYTYSYACIDAKDWSKQEDFAKLEPMFIKYVNNLPNGYQADFNTEEQQYQEISKFKFTRYAIAKSTCSLIASSIETFNYTKLPYVFESQYLYTYLFFLYQKLYLEKLDHTFEKGKKKSSKFFIAFLKELWQRPLTEDDFGSLYQKEIMTALRIGKSISQYKRKV